MMAAARGDTGSVVRLSTGPLTSSLVVLGLRPSEKRGSTFSISGCSGRIKLCGFGSTAWSLSETVA